MEFARIIRIEQCKPQGRCVICRGNLADCRLHVERILSFSDNAKVYKTHYSCMTKDVLEAKNAFWKV